ncbi:hypothetical protein, partial [Streptomyces sp. NPDC051173]
MARRSRWLLPHRVGGTPVLPGAAYLEFVREAAVQAEPGAAP